MTDVVSDSFRDIASSDVFISDAKALALIPSAQFSLAVKALDAKPPEHESLVGCIEESIIERVGIQAVINFLVNFTRMKEGFKLTEVEALDIFSPIVAEVLEEGVIPNRDIFIDRLPALLADYELVRREIKLADLAKENSASLKKFRIICDLRPLFSEEADAIEDIAPSTKLHIRFDSAGVSHAFDINLTESQVDDMLEKLRRAKKKLSLLDSLLPKLTSSLQAN